ncbi:hypothetical protein [Schleiferia thermophila]|uniref:Outer membrane protein beta-barrel domain-containing protein n=1 Tax=Schleiferia thermophila TaxID=884107 RepID=A0A369A3R2_9FLAO|nr:hypothetical protein [Schleiferia thermophila]RCX03962.1 hypothetical protein DES35_102421 [Schleiferia thermophila]GCD80195.1 hypothetical protein JCM30197_14420 [Schleiferia thermophila]
MRKLIPLFISSVVLTSAQLLGQTQKTDSIPMVNIQIEVDGTKISISTPDIRKISEKDLDEIVRNITQNAQKFAIRSEKMLNRIHELPDQDLRVVRQSDSLIARLQSVLDSSMSITIKSKNNWKKALDKHFEQFDLQLQNLDRELSQLESIVGVPHSANDAPEITIEMPGFKIQKDSVTIMKFPKSSNRSATAFHFSTGINQLGDNSVLDADLLRSWTFSIGVHGFRRFSPNSPSGLLYGLQYRWTAFGLNTDTRVAVTPTGTEFQIDPNSTATRSRLRSQSLEAPMLFVLSSRRGYTRHLYFGLGVFGGWRFANSTYVRDLTGANNMERNTITKASYHVNPLYAGARAILGFKGFTATASYEFNSYFRSQANLPNMPLMSLTIGVDLDD